jgi:hypothetical protein
MVPVGSSSFAVSNRAPGPGAAYQTEPTCVWRPGEHDSERSGGRPRRSEIAPSRHLISVCRATAVRTRAEGANGPEEIA